MKFLPSAGLLLALCGASTAWACSDFRWNSTSTPSQLSGRTMDFAIDLMSVAEVIPRGSVFQEMPARDCVDCPDYSWNAKYGFVALNIFGINVAADGMNEEGLSAAWLYLVGTDYPIPAQTDAEEGDSSEAGIESDLPVITSVCSYLLGNFATVKEVREGLKHIQIAEFDERIQIPLLRYNTGLERIPLHVSVHDAHGDNLVLEFLNGKTKIYDNINNVLTNEPRLTKQLKNFKKNGLDHLPGGYGSKARFVRLSVLNHLAADGYHTLGPSSSFLEGTQEQKEVSNVVHILNTVVLPPIHSATQWSIIRDHGRRKVYIQSTMNQQIRLIDLNQIDFISLDSRKLIPVSFGNWFNDVTPALTAPENTAKTMDLPPRSKLEELLRHLLGNADNSGYPSNLNLQASILQSQGNHGGYWTVFFAGSVFGTVSALVVVFASKAWKRRYAHRFTYERIRDPEEIKYRSF